MDELESISSTGPAATGPPPPASWFSGLDPAGLAKVIADVQVKHPDLIAQSNGDIYFALFMLLVDRRVQKLAGVSAHDLPDYQFRDAYDNGTSPRDVARDLLEENGFLEA